MREKLARYRQPLIVLADLTVFALSYYLAFLLRFDFELTVSEWETFLRTVWLVVAVRAGVFFYCDAYTGLWRYASISDLSTLLKAVGASQIAIVAAILLLRQGLFPRSVLFIDPVLALTFASIIRFGIRITREWRYRGDTAELPRLLIFGAGDLGDSIVRDIQRGRRRTHHIVGLVDDDPAKWHHRIHGFDILGGRQDLPRLIQKHRVDEIAVAVNHSRGQIIQSLMDICKDHGGIKVQFKTVPTIAEMLRSAAGRHRGIRNIELSDLLQRKSVQTDLKVIKEVVTGKVVLITGAGGTIGAELSRQILRLKPAKLLLLEKHNTALFYIDRELADVHSAAACLPIAGDVGDATLLENLFSRHKPQVVFHAAAHKHVPLMETNPQEAVKNNTLNTGLLAEKSIEHGVERFLFISTDKAVRPASVMGASKRMGEMVIRALAGTSPTKFMSVRFGNVLGSSGSAVNIFKEQIAQGGPVTVTHPDMTRYFMTTEEAVLLILQACAIGGGGEIFVLNMGEPVKVIDVARNLIRLSGLKPDEDIRITFTGRRPGEKMHEELFRDDDVRKDTGHPDIFAALSEEADPTIMRGEMRELHKLCEQPDFGPLLEAIRRIVPTYESGIPR